MAIVHPTTGEPGNVIDWVTFKSWQQARVLSHFIQRAAIPVVIGSCAIIAAGVIRLMRTTCQRPRAHAFGAQINPDTVFGTLIRAPVGFNIGKFNSVCSSSNRAANHTD